MRIAIISDIHDNLANLEKCLRWCAANRVRELICCGDLTNEETLAFLADNFSGRIYLVSGNVSLFDEADVFKYKNIKYYGRLGRFEVGGKSVGFCHEPFLIDYVLKQGPCDFIFYGHTHEPWTEKRGKATLVNPGTLSGTFSKATFAAWDTEDDKLELKVLEKLD